MDSLLQSLEINTHQGASSEIDHGMHGMMNSLEESHGQDESEWQNAHELRQTGGAMSAGMDGLLESLALIEEPMIGKQSRSVHAHVEQVGGGSKSKHSDLETKIKKMVLRKQKNNDKYLKEGNIRKLIQKYLIKNSNM